MQTERHSHIKYLLPIVLLSLMVAVLVPIALVRTNQLIDTQSTLTLTQNRLSDALTEVEATHNKLTTAEDDLAQAHTAIAATQSELTNKQNELRLTSDKLAASAENLVQTEQDLAATQEQVGTARQQIDTLQTSLNNVQVTYDRLTTGFGYVLKDPTYQEMKNFIAADRTDSKPYDLNKYNCVDFSADVIANAAKQKIRCSYVTIDFTGNTGHAIVAFNTLDRGLIYIEPQHDEEVNLQLGRQYYLSVIPKAGYYYTKPNYDDTITKFRVIW